MKAKQKKPAHAGANGLNAQLRQLPSVEQVLSAPGLAETLANWRRDIVKGTLQGLIDQQRAEIELGLAEPESTPSASQLAEWVADEMAAHAMRTLQPVVNATGIVLHTNLGRAVLSPSAQSAVQRILGSYTDLELDLADGARARRDDQLEQLLVALTGAQAATVVNNCAGAVLLALHALAHGREVLTSRGELVEIGGGFRVPEVAKASGCKLIEIGTTNRTRLADYSKALTKKTALLLKTHPSNFRIRGFTAAATVSELSALAGQHHIPLVVDLGSGYSPVAAGNAHAGEPTVTDILRAGADLVLFSGDKLLGGPQAGIIVGDPLLIHALRQNPLWRALRIDKFTAAALAATLVEHLRGQPGSPCYPDNVRARAQHCQQLATDLAAAIGAVKPQWKVKVIAAPGSWGGGSMPDEEIDSCAVAIEAEGMSADELDTRLRLGDPAIVGYKLKGRYALNMLTLLAGDAERVAKAISAQ